MSGKQGEEAWCGGEALPSPFGGVVLCEMLRGQICPPIWSAPMSGCSWRSRTPERN